MNKLAVRAGLAILGMVAMLAWWTFTGNKSDSKTGSATKMPEKKFGGGGPKVTIEVEVNGPATLGFMGTLPRKADDSQPLEEDAERIAPGTHIWNIELAPHTSGTFDLRANNPQVGNKLSWHVTVDGKEMAHESDTLDKPLQGGYAQDLQVRIERDEEPQPEKPEE
ncbi:MAG: hypothetical protein ACRD36_04330 [Candidatus Acidiferrum sp.]